MKSKLSLSLTKIGQKKADKYNLSAFLKLNIITSHLRQFYWTNRNCSITGVQRFQIHY